MNSVIISLVVLAAFATYLLAHHNRFDGIRALDHYQLLHIVYCTLLRQMLSCTALPFLAAHLLV